MEKREDGDENGDAGSAVGTADGTVTETSKVPFLMLGLDLSTSFQRCHGEKYHPTGMFFTSTFFHNLMWVLSFDVYRCRTLG